MNRDFLFAIFAVQLGFVRPDKVMGEAAAWLADKSQTLPDRLSAAGVIDQTRRAMLEGMVDQAVAFHGGDVEQTLAALGGDQAIFASFGGAIARDEHGAASLVSGSGTDGPAEDAAAVTPEAPGRYRFKGGTPATAEIGRGGIGRVLIAYDEHLGRELAVKELLPGAGGTAGATPISQTAAMSSRFLREARVTGQLEHPNIMPVYELGQRADGTLYYTMKLVRGKTLAAALGEARTLAERLRLLPHFVDLCQAVAYAHSRGVIHRDLKPENVMLGEFGETVVLDWGMAKVRGKQDIRGRELQREVKVFKDAEVSRTVDGSAIGTPAYMSPEQADGALEEIDQRSDVWSLGAVLYELLTGKPPFEGFTAFEIIGKVLTDAVVPAHERGADIPRELSSVCDKALTRDRARRYQSAKELADEANAYLTGGRVAAYDYSSWELVRRFAAKNRALSLGLAAVLVTLLTSAVVVFFAYGREQEARGLADEQRREAEVQRSAAVEQQRDAVENLSRGYLARAQHLIRGRAYGSAYVYAAAALAEAQRTERPLAPERRVALESALYESRVARSLVLAQTFPLAEAGGLNDMEYSRDGRRIALAHDSGKVSVITVDGSRETVTRNVGGWVTFVRFSPDGERLLAGDFDGVLHTLSSTDLAEVGVEKVRAGTVSAWALAADLERLVVVDGEQNGWLTRRSDPAAAIALGPVANVVNSVQFTADSRRLGRGTPAGEVAMHDGETGALLETIPISAEGTAAAYAFAPDGRRLLMLELGRASIYDLERRRFASHLTVDQWNLRGGAFAPDGHRVYLAGELRAGIWDGRRAVPDEVVWEESRVTWIEPAPDGQGVAVAGEGVVRIWEARRDERVAALATGGMPTSVDFSASGSAAIVCTLGGDVYLVDLERELPDAPVASHGTLVTGCAISPDGRRAVSIDDQSVLKLFDVERGAELRSLQVDRVGFIGQYFAAVDYSPDGKRIAVTTRDHRVAVLDAQTLAVERLLAAFMWAPSAVRFSGDGRYLIAGSSQGWISYWSGDSLRFIGSVLTYGSADTSDIEVLADGDTCLVADTKGWLRGFSLKTGELRGARAAHEVWVNRLAVAPDGVQLATGADDGTVRIWDAASLELLASIERGSQVAAVGYSPDGKLLALGGAELGFFPVLRDLVRSDGAALYEGAVTETGRRVQGFELEPVGEAGEQDVEQQGAAPGPVAPNQIRGFCDNGLAYGTPQEVTVELLTPEHEPLTPPVIGRPSERDGRLTLEIPAGVEHVAVRTTSGGNVTYRHNELYRPGEGHVLFFVTTAAVLAKLLDPVGVRLEAGKGHVMGDVRWILPQRSHGSTPVGCAEVSVENGGKVLYLGPPGFAVRPELERTHPGAASSRQFVVPNLEPGVHRFSARVGEHTVTRDVRVHADAVTMDALVFPADRFPDNPEPAGCQLD